MDDKKRIKSPLFERFTSKDLEQTGDKTFKKQGEEVIKKKYTKMSPKPDFPVVKKNDRNALSDEEKFEIIDEIFAPKEPPPKICFNCGTQLHDTDKFNTYRFNSTIYVCYNCYIRMPKCKHCGIPVKMPASGIAHTYCQFCKPSNGCNICSKNLTLRDAIFIPGVRGSYCTFCLETAEICYSCGKPGKDNIIRLNDGRHLCEDCTDISVISEDQAYNFNHKIISYIKNKLELNIKDNYLIYMSPYKEKLKKEWENPYYKWKYIESELYFLIFHAIPENQLIKGLSEHFAAHIFKMICPNIEYNSHRYQSFILWFSIFITREFGFPDDYYFGIKDNEDNDVIQRFYNLENRIGIKRLIKRISKGEMKWE